MKEILCFGDSNTYGYDPHDTNEGRYPKEVRWTGIMDTESLNLQAVADQAF